MTDPQFTCGTIHLKNKDHGQTHKERAILAYGKTSVATVGHTRMYTADFVTREGGHAINCGVEGILFPKHTNMLCSTGDRRIFATRAVPKAVCITLEQENNSRQPNLLQRFCNLPIS